MILVAKRSKPFEYTPKGTARRHVVVAKYADEIEEAYKAVETAAMLEKPVPRGWSQEENLIFLRGIVQDVFKKSIGNEDDLFENGCDRQDLGFPDTFRINSDYALYTTWSSGHLAS
jgi:hypothetical protein